MQPGGRELAVADEQVERRLVAILLADVAGYSRLIGIDDEGTLARLNAHHGELIEPKIREHRGRIVSVEIQRAVVKRNAEVPADRRIEFRMGVNVGDIVEGASIHGDGIRAG